VSPRRWGPPPSPHHVALWHGVDGTPGDPHGTATDPTLLRVTVAEVTAAAGTLLAGLASAPA
jgi:hypothetical protein